MRNVEVLALAGSKRADKIVSVVRAKSNHSPKELVKLGINPFSDRGSSYLAVATDALMCGPVAKSKLADLFQDRLGIKKSSAKSMVSVVWRTLVGLGIVEVHGKTLSLKGR